MNVLQMSISAGVLILLVVILRALAVNRLPKIMFIALWGVALCRLLIPFSIPSKWSIYSVINRMIPKVIWLTAGTANGSWDADDRLYRSIGLAEVIYKPSQVEPVVMLWAAGAGLLILCFTAAFYKCHREIKTALPVKGNALIDQWLCEQKTRRPVRILVSDKITTPLTYGILKPKIILPKSMDFSNEPQMRYILTHELIHIKRFDAVWKLVLMLALCCHWFNPAVWVLYVLMNRDLELACDEKVIQFFGESAKSAYALALIEMVERRAKFTPLYSSFSKNATEERIVSIMKFKKTSLLRLALALILVVGATSVFAESTVKGLWLHGIIRTDNGRFSFDLDDTGRITVKDADGKVVSTAVVGSDGKAQLTDGNGKIFKTLQLDIPVHSQEKRIKIYNGEILSGENGPEAAKGTDADGGMPPRYIAEVDEKGAVTIKDTGGKRVAAGTADSKGTVILTDHNGTQIGTAIVKKGRVARLTISVKANDKTEIVF